MKSKNTKIKNSNKEIMKGKKLHPNVAKLKGVLNLSPDYNYKEVIGEYLLDKYNKLK